MIDRRRMLMTAAAGAGIAATGACASIPGLSAATPAGPAASDPAVKAALDAFMDRTFERILALHAEAARHLAHQDQPVRHRILRASARAP